MFRVKMEKMKKKKTKRKTFVDELCRRMCSYTINYATNEKDPAFSLEQRLLGRGTKVFVYRLLYVICR